MSARQRKSASTLITVAVALFFLSMMMSGSSNALPQVFFLHHYPGSKGRLLAVALTVSTLAAIIGVSISRRLAVTGRVAALLILAICALAGVLLSTNLASVFIVCLAALQFSNNFMLAHIDHLAVKAAVAVGMRGPHDAATNTARLAGMLTAPLFFTAWADHAALEWGVIVGLGTAAFAAVGHFRAAHVHLAVEQGDAPHAAPVAADRLLFGHAVMVYTAMYLLAANMIYLLADQFRFHHAAIRGGAAIVIVFLFALIANAMIALLMKRAGARPSERVTPALLALPAVALSCAAGVVLSGRAAAYYQCILMAAITGVTFGGFLWALRNHCSQAAARGNATLLGWFNNIGNVSSLLAFVLMLLLSSAQWGEHHYFRGLMWLLLSTQATGILLLAAGAAQASRQGRRQARLGR